jgi:PAS domain S-box-containing protein
MEEELKAANAQAKCEHDAVLAAILDHASDGMLVIGQGGSVVIATAAAERQFGAPHGGLVGLSLGRLLGAEALRVAQGEYPPGELPELSGTTLDTRVFPVEFSCASLDMADGRRQLWIVRDISERVRAQNEKSWKAERFQDFAETSSGLLLGDGSHALPCRGEFRSGIRPALRGCHPC